MANEGVIKVVYPVSGLGTLTAKILKPDDTVRDAQSAVALDDTGHVNVYTNPGAITIVEGDSIVPYVGGVNFGNGETYRPALVDLNSYDPPTRTEATSDKAEIIVEVDANETKIDSMQGDVTTIAGDVAGLDGDSMVGTDGANTTVPDAAGTAAALHATTDALINGLNDPNVAAIADAVLLELVADHSGTAGSLAALIELVKDIAEADTVIDTSDSAQWVLIFNKKGTSTEIMRKNLKDINGAAVTATTAVLGAHKHTT